MRLPAETSADSLRIRGDRWLLAVARERASVIDMRDRGTVTRVDAPSGFQSTLLPNGTLAWIDAGGQLLATAPGATEPTVLEPAGGAATALASSRTSVYWTANGAAHRWHAAPAALATRLVTPRN